MASTTIRRLATAVVEFDHLGPAPARRGKTDAAPSPLVLTIPPHTSRDASALAGYLTEHIHRYVLMFLPTDVRHYTVTVDITTAGNGTATITEALHGADRFRRTARALGTATIRPLGD